MRQVFLSLLLFWEMRTVRKNVREKMGVNLAQ